MKVRGTNAFGRASRLCFENFFVNDPIEASITLSAVTETAYTNPLFVPSQAKVLLGGQPLAGRSVRAEVQKAPQLIAEIR